METMGRRLGATVIEARVSAHSGGPTDGGWKADSSVYISGRHLEPADRTAINVSRPETMAVSEEVHSEYRRGLREGVAGLLRKVRGVTDNCTRSATTKSHCGGPGRADRGLPPMKPEPLTSSLTPSRADVSPQDAGCYRPGMSTHAWKLDRYGRKQTLCGAVGRLVRLGERPRCPECQVVDDESLELEGLDPDVWYALLARGCDPLTAFRAYRKLLEAKS